MNQRAIYIGKSPFLSNGTDYLSYGMTGTITGECLEMYWFEPDYSPEICIVSRVKGWLVERSEIYFPAA